MKDRRKKIETETTNKFLNIKFLSLFFVTAAAAVASFRIHTKKRVSLLWFHAWQKRIFSCIIYVCAVGNEAGFWVWDLWMYKKWVQKKFWIFRGRFFYFISVSSKKSLNFFIFINNNKIILRIFNFFLLCIRAARWRYSTFLLLKLKPATQDPRMSVICRSSRTIAKSLSRKTRKCQKFVRKFFML